MAVGSGSDFVSTTGTGTCDGFVADSHKIHTISPVLRYVGPDKNSFVSVIGSVGSGASVGPICRSVGPDSFGLVSVKPSCVCLVYVELKSVGSSSRHFYPYLVGWHFYGKSASDAAIIGTATVTSRKDETKHASPLLNDEELPEKMRSFSTCFVHIFRRSADINIDY